MRHPWVGLVLLLVGCPSPDTPPTTEKTDQSAGSQTPTTQGTPTDGAAATPPDGAAPPTDGAAAGNPDGNPDVPEPPPQLDVAPGTGVKVSGTLSYKGSETGKLRLDILQADGEGYSILKTDEIKGAGPFELELPKHLGTIAITSFLDIKGDGPDAGDPQAEALDIKVEETPISGIKLELEVGKKISVQVKPRVKDVSSPPPPNTLKAADAPQNADGAANAPASAGGSAADGTGTGGTENKPQ